MEMNGAYPAVKRWISCVGCLVPVVRADIRLAGGGLQVYNSAGQTVWVPAVCV